MKRKFIMIFILIFFILIIYGNCEVKAGLVDTGSNSFSSASGGGVTLNLNSIAGTSKNMTASDEKSSAWDLLEADRNNVYCSQLGIDMWAGTYDFSNFITVTNTAVAYALSIGKNSYYKNDVSQNVLWTTLKYGAEYTGGSYSRQIKTATEVNKMGNVNTSIRGSSNVCKVLSSGEVVTGPYQMNFTDYSFTLADGRYYQLGYLESVQIKGYLQSDPFTTPRVISSSYWKYCDGSGSNISTPSSGEWFYIKFNNNVKRVSDINITTKKFRVTATYISATSSKSQNLYILKSYDRRYVTNTATYNPWLNTTGTLKLRKVDYDSTSKGLSGAKFILQCSNVSGSSNYVRRSGSSISFTSKSNATVFTSDSSGYINIGRLPVGRYYCIETQPPAPSYKYIDRASQVAVMITGGNTVNEALVKNIVRTGNLVLKKVDYDTGQSLNLAQMIVYKKVNGVNQYVVNTSSTSLPTFTTNKSSATKFYTNSTIYNLLEGTYYVEEIKSQNEQYTVLSPATSIKVVRNSSVTATVKNKRMVANIQILKLDYDTYRSVSGAQFVVYRMNGSYKEYVASCSNSTTTITTYTTSKSLAKRFAGGEIVYNLIFSSSGTTYYVEEVKTPSAEYPILPTNSWITLTNNNRLSTINFSFTNVRYVANLNILKIDRDTGSGLQGVEFEITRINTKTNATEYIYGSGGSWYVSSNRRTVYTDYSGRINFTNLLLKTSQTVIGENVYDYKYRVREVSNSVTDYDGDYIYQGDSYYDSGIFSFSRLENKSLTVTNERQIIDFKGYVWEEKHDNNLYGSGDRLLSGIVVKLINTRTGSVIQTTTTARDGSYKFNNINLPSIRNYSSYSPNRLNVKIVFEYDGFEFECVNYSSQTSGSKAIESVTNRKNLNQRFAQVTGTNTDDRSFSYFRNEDDSKTYKITYKRGSVPNASVTPDNNGINKTNIEAGTDIANHNLEYRFGVGYVDTIFGLNRRKNIDLDIDMDLVQVDLNINNKRETYTNDLSQFSIYESDINEKTISEDRQLKAILKYKVVLKNNTNDFKIRINELVNYYTSGLQINNIYNEAGQKINNSDISKYGESLSYSGYENNYINQDFTIDSKENVTFYIELLADRQYISLNLNKNTENLIEISSYTTFHPKSEYIYYPGIDENTTPGSIIPGNSSSYEDDTGTATVVFDKKTQIRETTGKVFVDTTPQEFQSGEERKGDGEYKNGEKAVSGVMVTFVEKTGTGLTYKTITNNDGEYTVLGYIPGDYVVQYVYGNDPYDTYNYKSTIYKKDKYIGMYWYTNTEKRLSDAVDSWEIRKRIDKGEETMMTSETAKFSVEVDTAKIKEMDFGIAERTRDKISILKEISNVKVTLSDGTILLNGNPAEVRIPHVKYIKPQLTSEQILDRTAPYRNGMIWMEMDKEYMQGAQIEVKYKFKAKNMGEVDYYTENYYKYYIPGKPEEQVQVSINSIVDYVDNNLKFSVENNDGWLEITDENRKLLTNESQNTFNVILHSQVLKGNLKVFDEIESKELTLTQVISADSQDMNFNNVAEVFDTTSTRGYTRFSDIITKNYNSEKGVRETDECEAVEIIITPPTGQRKMIIGIGITLSAVLGISCTIICIKKKKYK
ncbi:MAG: SpaA isopeptide-forming pilin-related protein [Clostridia bacterium]|nr:SpaA isopeptide-forming pilin-related protein [Clostridia bacterium]